MHLLLSLLIGLTLQQKVNLLWQWYQPAESTSTINRVINCESSAYGADPDFIHYNINKKGVVWSIDYGPLMVNDYYHTAEASSLGLNLKSENGALIEGFVIMKREGLSPWKASENCWSNPQSTRISA